ncbi:alpha/beta hydrolase [Corynebacterium fournieri]|uniref:alpha/beta hydrolase n=1 Tax=Corynebacterium fournieri TaxID=1852390 RepID=UPI000A2F020D|nr:alpha/beta hydrolase family protein [Corynebacterium fournieri]WJY98440.1 Diacylglycerol acyltransferase/mycolyltransferase Ag85C precursor [Corynebacterium fournieri]
MNSKNSVRRKLTALLMALLSAVSMVVGAPQASAAHRDWLRPDSTGTCEWDRVGFWVQRCTVWSPAMGRHITVQIQPAQRGGNAGLYMLDGLRATEITNAWVNDVNAARTFKDNNITLVMPVGGQSSFYTDWNAPATYDFNHPVTYKWDTFLSKELPSYLQTHFGVSPTNNSILGLSMGGTAAINLAALHPQQFRQVLSFSGYLTTTIPGGQTALRAALLDGGLYNLNAMWGSVLNPRRYENDPFLNMGNLRGRDVYVSAGSGVPGPADEKYLPQHRAAGIALETIASFTTRLWSAKATVTGVQHTAVFTPTGLHNWDQFGSQLEANKGRILNVMNAW